MTPRSRLVLVSCGAVLATLATISGREGQAGFFDHLGIDYHRSKIDYRRPVEERPTRRTFMRKFSPEMLLELTAEGFTQGYMGQDLSKDGTLERIEVAFLLGRLIRMVNRRDGKIFGGERRHESQAPWVPRSGWGLFESEAAVAERLFRPTVDPAYWKGPVTRYELTFMAGKLLKTLEEHYELIRFYEVHPERYYEDFVAFGHPWWETCRRPMEYALVGDGGGAFRGFDAVKASDVLPVVWRLRTLAQGYRIGAPSRPWIKDLLDSSNKAVPFPLPYPQALHTIPRDFPPTVAYPRDPPEPTVLPRQRTFDDWAPEVVDRPR